jgi:hypothetical protein
MDTYLEISMQVGKGQGDLEMRRRCEQRTITTDTFQIERGVRSWERNKGCGCCHMIEGSGKGDQSQSQGDHAREGSWEKNKGCGFWHG